MITQKFIDESILEVMKEYLKYDDISLVKSFGIIIWQRLSNGTYIKESELLEKEILKRMENK